MTTTTPMFATTRRHTALGFAVIASLFLSLAVGFVATTSGPSRSGGPELRAATISASTNPAS